MSSLPVASQIEILDLRHFSARQLRPVLESEAQLWLQRLRWNYKSATELLLEYLDSRILPGFVALDRGRVCGFTFCVYEGHKAVIGDAFAAGHRAIGDIETTQVLLLHLLEMLKHNPTVDRIEAQLLLFNAGELANTFTDAGFAIHPRLYLECDLRRPVDAQPPELPQPLLPPDLEFSPWTAQDYQAAGELIHACYVGHADAHINDQYRSLHGSLRFLHNIVRFPGCGVFAADFSWVLREKRSGALVGLVLSSRVAADVAHITQLCVSQAYRHKGLGLLLLRHCAASLVEAGYAAITLTVTEANEPAVRLYRQFGFVLRHRFDAMVLDKTPLRR
jgi:ribosomal protein S18 acetylase RimI-like enzyme